MTTVFKRGSITGEIDASYSPKADGGLAVHGATAKIVRTGPRGGRTTLWSGDIGDIDQMVDDLHALRAGLRDTRDLTAEQLAENRRKAGLS